MTPNVLVRGELGRYTIDTIRTERLIKYWLKLLQMPDERLPKICYNLQCKWLEAKPRTNCWAKDVKDTLLAQGFGYAWYNQGVGNIALFLRNFKERNRDIDISCLFNDIHNMDRLRTYKILKTNFGCERYLKEISISSYKQVLVKFRGGLLDLRANSGRFENIPLEDRTCNLCNMEVETEYHFLFICSHYHSLRNQYLSTYFFNYPSEMKFKHLMDLNDVQLKTNLCKYIIEALKLRAELLMRVRI